MTILLSHATALEFYRRVKTRPSRAFAFPHAVDGVENAVPRSCRDVMELLERNGLGRLSLPIHLMATKPDVRRRYADTVCHVYQRGLPERSFLRVTNGIAVASPELCFVRAASSLPLAKLLKLGYEACGSYALTSGSEAGFVNRQPVTTVKALSAYIATCGRMNGCKRSERALSYLLDNAASPMETISAMLLCLPCRHGGQGLPPGELNGIVQSDAFARSLTGKSHMRADILWREAHLAVEYDSDRYHTGSDRIAEDASRRAALAHLGYETVTITRQHVLDMRRFNAISELLARRLGVRRRSCTTWMDRQLRLRSDIIDFSSEHREPQRTVEERLCGTGSTLTR